MKTRPQRVGCSSSGERNTEAAVEQKAEQAPQAIIPISLPLRT